jgi:thioredoxin-dependent peroxiredoxin
MTHLRAGMKAPAFRGNDQNGIEVKLSDYTGKKVILYFYPKDNTPGCTAEACNLRDNNDEFTGEGLEIIGVSPDDEKSHLRFSEKFNLSFPLIADISKKILKDYGVWVEKKMFGKSYMGVARTTFIIDEKGVIEHIISKVNTINHSSQILKLYNK